MHALPVLLLSLRAPIVAFVPYETAGGTPLHWPPGATIPVLVGQAPPGLVEADVLAITTAAVEHWLDTPCDAAGPIIDLRPDYTIALADTALVEDDLNVSLVWITDPLVWQAQGFGSTELAHTIVLHRAQSGVIVDSDIAFNFAGFDFSTDPSCAPDDYDFAGAVTHELGHVLGLDHTPVAGATMAAKSNVGECDKRTLGPDDQAGFCTTYTEPRPPDPEPGPEPEPQPEIVEAEPERSRDDGSCAGGQITTWVVLLTTLARRASVRRRR